MRIKFWGATDDVTGSMTFLELPEGIVMVDAGLAQGTEQAEKLNRMALPYQPKQISAVLLTHAHLDHSGYLPRLVKKGFTGTIYCTHPTAKLAHIILMDSAKIEDFDLYDEEDVAKTMQRFKIIEWDHTFTLLGAHVRYFPAGHILGASSISLDVSGKKYVFSGDLGRCDDPLLPPGPACPPADVIVMESTYGGKVRTAKLEQELQTFLTTISREKRIGIIASFAVARAQMLLTLIHQYYQRHPEEKVRLVIDGPMMKLANQVYKQYAHLTHCSQDLYTALDEVESIDYKKQWESLGRKTAPLIILSSSGMLTGGRVMRNLFHWHNDPRAVLFLPGYQGEGTPGRSFQEGGRTLMASTGESFTWSGQVMSSEAFSSHADQSELLRWVTQNNSSAEVFLLHGSEQAKSALKDKLTAFPQVSIPERGAIVEF